MLTFLCCRHLAALMGFGLKSETQIFNEFGVRKPIRCLRRPMTNNAAPIDRFDFTEILHRIPRPPFDINFAFGLKYIYFLESSVSTCSCVNILGSIQTFENRNRPFPTPQPAKLKQWLNIAKTQN